MLGFLKTLHPGSRRSATSSRRFSDPRRSSFKPALESLEERQMLSQMVSLISPIGNQDGTGRVAALVRVYGPITND